MDVPELVSGGRSAFRHGAWAEALHAFARADREKGLDPEDLERLATAAYLVGRDEVSSDTWARAHREFLDRGETERSIRCAFWLAFGLLHRGERARAGGWLARAERLLEECGADCVERGYLLLPAGLRRISEGDGRGAHEAFTRAAEFAARFDDPDLAALALHSRGRVLIRLGRVKDGVDLLDEAMAAVAAREVSPAVVGDVYCSVIEGCLEIFDIRRAQEWTGALTRWCETQPDLAAYRGQCLVRRSELMRLRGEWSDALEEATRASEWLTRPPGEPAAGAAFYEKGEIHRLEGDFNEAETAYREAAKWGKKPLPGLALLRLAQHEPEAAETSIGPALEAASDPARRARLLPAFVEILLATERVPEARAAADELIETSERIDAPVLRAMAGHADGAVLLGEGHAGAALKRLREAQEQWQAVRAPYEEARVRVLLAEACRQLGDADGADIELETATAVFEELGAAPDLAGVRKVAVPPRTGRTAGLTPRELQVVRLLATGRTNRRIAAGLHISERTVARHVSNIFRKLRVSTRAAATAYAYEHDLVEPRLPPE